MRPGADRRDIASHALHSVPCQRTSKICSGAQCTIFVRNGRLPAGSVSAAFIAVFAEQVAKDGILVNAVVTLIMDVAARQAMPKADFVLWPKVEEVTATIVFLASPTTASPVATSCRCMGSLKLRFPGKQTPEFIRNEAVHMLNLLTRQNISPFVDRTKPAVVVDARLPCARIEAVEIARVAAIK